MVKIGVLGGGQLGRMLALAGIPLGYNFSFLDPAKDAPAAALGTHVCTSYSPDSVSAFADSVDILTFEFENVPADTLSLLQDSPKLSPSIHALEISQDRLTEKRFMQSMGIPVAPFKEIFTMSEVAEFLREHPDGLILKTRRMGYDGKGQLRIKGPSDINKEAVEAILQTPCIAEALIPFDLEVSLISASNESGRIFYPLTQNTHRDGILRRSIAPVTSLNLDTLQDQAEIIMTTCLNALSYRGVLTIEFFVKDNMLIVNEIAPRVHNSGHWTIEGAETSQFENHIRAITGMPLGSTHLRGDSTMFNIIGDVVPERNKILALQDVHLHLYGKTPRKGRKVGHITVVENMRGDRSGEKTSIEALLSE